MSEFNVPKGWKLVPVESTPAMDAAGAATFPALNFDEVAAEWAWNAMLDAAPAAPVVQAEQHPELTVWEGAMPESNGKSNFTAVLMRKGADLFDGISGGMTIARSEYPDRVRYEADCVRWLIGELTKEPCITDYDADKHSGYAAPQPEQPLYAAPPVCMGCVDLSSHVRELEHKMDYYKAQAAPPAHPDADEWPPCDYCGAQMSYHPWHGSGMFRGKESPHIHACCECRHLLPHPDASALVEALESMTCAYRMAIQAGHARITALGGDCDSVEQMLADLPEYGKAIAMCKAHRVALAGKGGAQ